jgi:class 3 adenylate cyclase/DNA-binding transcriptional MerR regulator
MTPEEFSDLVGLPVDVVEKYQELGLLDPENDGLLDDVDLVRLDFVHHRLAHGEFDPETLAAAIREGRTESMYGRRLFEAGEPLGLEEAAERTGLEPDQLQQLTSALGFSWNGLRGADMDFLEIVRVSRDAGLPWEAILGVTRVVGDSLRRIADSEIRVVHVYIHERLMAAGASEDEVEQLIFGIEQNLVPLMDPMLQRLHREYLLEAMVEDAFFHLAQSDTQVKELGSVEATIAFVDIASFTALAEASGDDTAMQVLDRIDATVRPLLVDHDGKLVKQVGDGFMLAFRDPADGVRFAVATQAELASDPELPAIRVGINTGPALYRTGDYLGGAVNVASRVVNSAMPGQILLTDPVATAAIKAGIEVEELGVRMMRGVDDPLALYRVKPS